MGRLFIHLIGAPGSGKSTLGQQLAKEFSLQWLSVGELLRREGRMPENGQMAPDEDISPMMLRHMDGSWNGAVLDGFPRTPAQDRYLRAHRHETGGYCIYLWLSAPDSVLVPRMQNRKRDDDSETIIRNRLDIFRKQTLPIVTTTDMPLLYVRADGTPDDTFREACVVLALSPVFRRYLNED